MREHFPSILFPPKIARRESPAATCTSREDSKCYLQTVSHGTQSGPSLPSPRRAQRTPPAVNTPSQTHMQATRLQRHVRAHKLRAYTLTCSHLHMLTQTHCAHSHKATFGRTRVATLDVACRLCKAVGGQTYRLRLSHTHSRTAHPGPYPTPCHTARTGTDTPHS